MKATVCFGDVRVVVPCGDGQLTIGELTELAIARYRKATNKSQDIWVNVHHLKSSDGGFLDPDDKVADVIDDKEQITAIFDVNLSALHKNNGDGTSSAGTSSPDVFNWAKDSHNDLRDWQRIRDPRDEVIIDEKVRSGSSITSGYGSEKPLMEVIRVTPSPRQSPYLQTFESSIIQPNNRTNFRSVNFTKSPTEPDDADDLGNSADDSAFRAFMRTASRKSLNNGTAMMQWLEAQERVQNGYTRSTREEPIGSSDEAEVIDHGIEQEDESSTADLVEIKNPGCAFGIHVAPSIDENGRNCGLEITLVEPGGFADQDQRLRLHDCIYEVNGQDLHDLSFPAAQELLRDAFKADVIRLKIRSPHSPPISSSPTNAEETSPTVGSSIDDANVVKTTDVNGKTDSQDKPVVEMPAATRSKSPPELPVRNPSTVLTTKTKFVPILSTRVIGQKLNISLRKGEDGLGFSVTTRDNQAGDDCPIHVKNILPQGAAIADGRLRSGDRILEINGASMFGKTQADAVAILRNVKVGGMVDLLVSRHSDDQASEAPDQSAPAMTSERNQDQVDHSKKERNILCIRISGLEQGSSLGIDIKGKSEADGRDVGIFVQSINKDGAARRDGRLQREDRILEVNGKSLAGLSNTEAISVLRQNLRDEQGTVNLTIGRIADRATVKTDQISSAQNSLSRSETLDGKISTIGSDRIIRTKKRELGARNMSYQLATNSSLLDEFIENLATTQEEPSGIQMSRPPSSLTDSNARASVTTTSSDFESDQNRPSAFDRDALGRRSMSEKRRAFVDPKSSIFYQKIKGTKDQQEMVRLRKSSSTESLVNQGTSASKQSSGDGNAQLNFDNVRPKRSNSMKIAETVNSRKSKNGHLQNQPVPLAETKSRTWNNESFRTAVDRYYMDSMARASPDTVNAGFSSQEPRLQVTASGHEAKRQTGYMPTSRKSDINVVPRPSDVLPTSLSNRKLLTPTSSLSTHQPPATITRWQQQPSHMVADRNGYPGNTEAKPVKQVTDSYGRTNRNNTNPNVNDQKSSLHNQQPVTQSAYRTPTPSAALYHPCFGPPIGPLPNSNHSNYPGSYPGTPSRTNTARQNRAEYYNRGDYVDTRTQSGDKIRVQNEGRSNNNHPMTCDSFPNLTYYPTNYLNDLTNATKSSRELSVSSGISWGVQGSGDQPVYWPLANLPSGVVSESGLLNRVTNESRRKPGLIVSSGAYV